METAQGSALPDQFPSLPGAVSPLYHVMADLGEFAGGTVIPALSSSILAVNCLVLRHEEKIRVLLANFTAQNQPVHLPGLRRDALVRWLVDTNVEHAMFAPEAYRAEPDQRIVAGPDALKLDLPPFAVVRIDGLSLA
jgi:hypothetical protein